MRAAGIEGPQACAKGLRHAFGLGRNVDTFDWLGHYAYREVRLWWVPGGGQAVFMVADREAEDGAPLDDQRQQVADGAG